MTAVLVTGGAGYIGAHSCKYLHDAGFTPVCFDNFSTGHRDFVRWGPLVEGDLLDPATIREAMDRHRPVAIMHFAANALVGESVVDPAKYYRNNSLGSFNLIEAARASGIRHFVFSSTCASYGVPTTVPIPEDHPQTPINAYGSSKLVVEQMLHHYGPAYGIGSVALRYFNAAGALPGGDLGEDHEPETHLIPLAIEAALGLRPPLQVLGTDYPTPDGTAVRDYIHVCDLADAHVAALRHLIAGGESARLNLGTGTGASVREVIATVERVLGLPVPHADAPRRPGDPPALVADAGRARALLGWEPRMSSLERIVADACEWHRKRRGV
jgi:UDP-arabinose 4-epimerase